MKHSIDLSKYCIRTDLAIDIVKDNNQNTIYENDIKVTSIILDNKNAKKISKKPGIYITISFEDVTDNNNKNKVIKTFKNQLSILLEKIKIKKDSYCLVIGLGNDKSTPDSLGPGTVDRIIVTNHLYELGNLGKNFRRVSAFNPGVMGTTGLETSDIIKSIVDKTKPDFIIIIDALASNSIERINRTIQITNTGIHPGSGIGNHRKEISYETMGIPVIAVGVPTTVDAVSIVSDTIDYMAKHFTYTKNNIDNPLNKLITKGNINYLKKNISVTQDDRKRLLGLIGNLNNHEIRKLIEEVLTPVGYNLMVTPKEIDFVIEKLCEVISEGINTTLNEKKV